MSVDSVEIGSIGPGLLILVGVGHDDTDEIADQMAGKAVDLRIFRDADGKTNLSLVDVGGEVLAVSQFTWRYQLPLLVLLPPAGALGIAALTGRTAPHEKRE